METLPPTDGLIRLAYVSTLLPQVTDADITELIVKAAKKNRDRGITGVLAIEGDRVCQILEGPREAVETLYSLIERDDRHQGVMQIVHQAVIKSAFEDWGMVRRKIADIAVYAMTS